MERINLIPDGVAFTWSDRLFAVVDQRMWAVLGWGLVAVCLVEGVMTGNQAMVARRYGQLTAALEQQRTILTAELENAAAFLTQMDRTEQDLTRQVESLTKRLEHLKGYQAKPGEWAAILQDIKGSLPYGVWLTELESTGRWQLRMVGGAFTTDYVSRFMSQLKTLPRFSAVSFNFTRLGKIGQTGIVEFEVACQLSPDEAA